MLHQLRAQGPFIVPTSLRARVGNQEFQLGVIGLTETANHAVLLAIAIGGTDERLQLQLSEELCGDLIALRERIVYFAKRIVMTGRPQTCARVFD